MYVPTLNQKISLWHALAAILSAFMFFSASTYAAKPVKNRLQQVVVAPVQSQQISDRIEALGTARANESVILTANVSEKVEAIYFDDGQLVQTDDVMVVLEQDEEKATLAQAKALLGERQLALQRLLRLEKKKLAPTDELDRARLNVEQAEANINAIQARINDRVIRAPFNGVVGLRNISQGSLVETGNPVATLDDISLIKLDFTLPAVYLSDLKPGIKIRAHAKALASQVYEGEIKSIDSRIDPVTRSIQVRAVLANPEGRIIPGMLLQIDVLRNTRQALMIPEAALLPLGDKQFVMLRSNKDGSEVALKRQVQIGTRIPGFVEVTGGLASGEQVITHGSNKVKPGGLIKVLAVDDGSVDISSIIKGKPVKGQQP